MDVLHAREWEHYLSRPASLFLASIWQKWYSSGFLKNLQGTSMPECLMIEEKRGISANYIPKGQLEEFWEKTRELVLDREKLRKVLERGAELNRRAEKLLEGTERLDDLREGLAFIIELGICSTQTPRAVLMEGIDDDLLSMAQDLRTVSHYPRIVEELLVPLAQKEAGLDKTAVLNSTVEDILSGTQKKTGKGRFIYSVIDGRSDVQWVEDIEQIMRKLRDIPDGEREITGQTAFPGKVKGMVRIIDTGNYKTAEFNEGDILVSINSNPTYIALIKKAGALVTDEGGLGCHAAIVSREIKKPCVIGTRYATNVLKDGDVVEVDADNGVVRKIAKKP